MFYDAHIHKKNKEAGGFIIALEGQPQYDSLYTNVQAVALHDPANNYISFQYVLNDFDCKCYNWNYLKFHPRRERYSKEWVMHAIRINNPRCVILDTLNEPYWQAYDYWEVAKNFPDVCFVFAHAGGYLINEFIKICHFQPNVWIDFSYTQTILGHYGNSEIGLPYINHAIKYAMHSSFQNRILMSSDFPFCSQDEVLSYYSDYQSLLNNNFIEVLKKIQ